MIPSILVVEDDTALAEQYAEILTDDGHPVVCTGDGRDAVQRARAQPPSLVVLDVGLPGLNGLDVVRHLRYARIDVPVMIVSARDGELDRVLGVELGADAYLTKPVGLQELRTRVRALLRRRAWDGPSVPTPAPLDERLRFGGLEIDPAARRVWRDGEELFPTVKEYDLLLHFARAPGRVFTARQLLQAVWHTDFAGYEKNVKTFVNRLRARVEPDPAAPQWVLTVRGVGYRGIGPDDGLPA